MRDFKNISISGEFGTGTSTLMKNLAKELGWEFLSAGDYFRAWHKEHNIPVEQSDKIPEELDRELDDGFQNKMKSEEKLIFESHIAGWLARDIPTVFKVLLTCEFEVAMKRIAEREGISQEEATKKSEERLKSFNSKIKKLYGLDNYLNPDFFDLQIDTTNLTPEQVLEKVLAAIS